MGLVEQLFAKVMDQSPEAKRAAKIERLRDYADYLNVDQGVFDTMLNFSEYLDTEGLVLSEHESGDTRSHEDLVDDFLAGLLERMLDDGEDDL